MSRSLSPLFGPELVLAVLAAGVFWFCARHNSGEGRDILVLEKLVMLLPLLIVPPAFATIFVPGAKTWWWLGRTVVFTYIVLLSCAGRIIAGFGEGAKGQDAAFILVLAFGTVMIAAATSVTGAMILATQKPAFGAWFGARKILGSLLTALAAVPIGLLLGLTSTVAVALVASIYSAFKR